jgi:hypothetical protein|tara:strand:+ start:37 stop:804 length:768 start_codon:yes stop_codon:yes gene_type:complete
MSENTVAPKKIEKPKFPTEFVDLPSKGLLYPKDHTLSSGKVEMKYMTAKEEDILTNQSYIKKGIVLDKLIEALIIDKSISIRDFFTGDKNAILIASRVLGYGSEYEIMYAGEKHTVDLSKLENKEIDDSIYNSENDFEFKLPHSETNITFQLLNGKIEKKIEDEVTGIKKIKKDASPEATTRLKHIITSVEGDTSGKTIREFVDTYFLARDARALREYIVKIQPDVELKWQIENDEGEFIEIDVPISLNFFFPDA